jgi:serine/threonine-protein kinase
MSTDRNLLFGILALQMDFVSRDQLVAAMHAWVLDKAKLLGEILAAQGVLSSERVALLTALMAEHLKEHGGDAEKSLAALSSIGSAKKDLEQICDADVQASLGVVGAARSAEEDDPFATKPLPTMGQATSTGLRFRILRPHAEGGLGRVYVADDGELHREVALKEIKDKFADHPESRARFVVEAEITGGLEHPGIVPVYGLGTYMDGRPFYAMRFIRGDSLKEAVKWFHDSKVPNFDSLEFRQLLRRFVDVCNAIAYAHSRKVLHRDLKPGNIMLGKFGETLVVDWGLAKALHHGASTTASVGTVHEEPPLAPASGSSAGKTLPGETVGTPEFMSPEQAAGRVDLLGPPTDIYALGATLYAILTGRAPVKGGNVAEVLHKVVNGDIAPAQSIVLNVPVPLAAVAMKAMELRPADRYGSALNLAKEVERWLADEPVTAYREPLAARTRRWVRKNARLVTGVGAVLAVGVLAVGGLAWQREQARAAVEAKERETARERDAKESERSRAVAARARTRLALDEMVSEATGESLATQKAISAEQEKFLENVLKYYEEFAAEPGEDKDGRERLAKANSSLGKIRHRLGQHDEGAAVFRRAAELYAGLAADFPDVPDYRQELARSQFHLGLLLRRLAKWTEAEAAYRAALEIGEKLVADFPRNPKYRQVLAHSQNNLGNMLADQDRRADAEAADRAALDTYIKLAADFPDEPDYRQQLATSQNNLGLLLVRLRKWVAAEAAYRAALEIGEKLVADFPRNPKYRQGLAHSQNNLGSLFRYVGKLDKAEAAHRAAITVRERLAAEFPLDPQHRTDLASSYSNLGNVIYSHSDAAAAVEWHTKAIELLTQLVAAEPRLVEGREFLRNSHWGRADDFTELKRYAEALSDWERALEFDDGSYRSELRVCRAGTLIHLARTAEAVREAGDLAADKKNDAETVYACAGVFALAFAAPKNADADHHAARAVELLRQAVAKGYSDFPHMLTDPDLAPLRGRADYADLLWDLADMSAK